MKAHVYTIVNPADRPGVATKIASKQIILIRHGQGTHNRDLNYKKVDPKLTNEGKAQAKKLQPLSIQRKCQLLVVSPLSRAIESAALIFPWATKKKNWGSNRRVVLTKMHTEAISANCDKGRTKSKLAKDYAYISSWEGFDELEEKWTFTADNDTKWKTERLPKFLQWLLDQPESNIVVVGHSSFFKECLDTKSRIDNCALIVWPEKEIRAKLDKINSDKATGLPL